MWLALSLWDARHRLVDQAQSMLIEDAKVLKGAISREVHRALRTQFLRRPSAGPAIVVSQGIGSLLAFFFWGGADSQGNMLCVTGHSKGLLTGRLVRGTGGNVMGCVLWGTVFRSCHAWLIDLACGSSFDCSTTT